MRRRRTRIELYDVEMANHSRKEVIKWANKLINDPKKNERLEAQECIPCFYSQKIGGCAITTTNCRGCGQILHFSSTNTDELCKQCATKLKLCAHCGADIELKGRRNIHNLLEDINWAPPSEE